MEVTWIIIGGVVLLAICYLAASRKIIGPDEKGVLIHLGQAVRELESGFHWCWYFWEKVVIYKMSPLEFVLKVPTAITKNGKVKGYRDDSDEIEVAELDIYITLITYLPSAPGDLLAITRILPGGDVKSLGKIIAAYVLSVTRVCFGEMPWLLAYQERRKMVDYILSDIKPNFAYYDLVETDFPAKSGKRAYTEFSFCDDPLLKVTSETECEMATKNPFVQFHLDTNRTYLNITNIDFCNPDLAKKISSAEDMRLKVEAERIQSLRDADKIREKGDAEIYVERQRGFMKTEVDKKHTEVDRESGRVTAANREDLLAVEAANKEKMGIVDAEARGLMLKEISKDKDLEYLHSMVEMAKGTSNTILYQLPSAFENKISEMLGGNKPTSLLELLKDKDFMETVNQRTENLTKNPKNNGHVL